jgi:CRISPR type III-B/RAMP module-associated protein Cmr3
MSTPYLITFTPVNRFFFGSSHSFAEGFFAESMKYPQPTTILGCLRNTILIQQNIVTTQNGRHIPDITNTEAQKFTGTSMVNGLNDNNDNFGVIEKLSPVFIVKQGNDRIADILFPAPADMEKIDNFFRYITYKRQGNAISSYSGKEKPFAILSDRNPKLPEVDCIGGKEFWSAYLNNQQISCNSDYAEDKIFITHTSVGIGRKDRVAEEGMFYTKIDYSLYKDFSFGVIVWLRDNNILKNDVVLLGGEQSAFRMEISPISDDIFSSHPVINAILSDNCDFFKNLNSCTNNEKLVALSPLVFDETINSSLTDIMEHRIVKGIHSIKTIKKVGAIKSEAVCMVPAGSVLYPEKAMNSSGWEIPYKIGYNHVIKIKRGKHV